MARFIGYLNGNRGEASRLGSESSGLRATANGWDFGVHVRLYVNDQGEDCADITLTGGSNGGPSRFLGTYSRKDLEGPAPTA